MADNHNAKQGGTPRRRRAYKITAKRARAAGVMCLAFVCIALLFISPLFNIRSIYVRGNNHLSSKEILDASGIKKGDNIFSVNTTRAVNNIEKLSRADKCQIERTLPGKVTLTVTEKTESAYVKVKTGYAGSKMLIRGREEYHHSQLGVNHYQKTVS